MVLTVYGIETRTHQRCPLNVHHVATAPTVYGIETVCREEKPSVLQPLQQHLPFTVCAEGCETAEEQSDDEGRTSQVPERSEGKTKLMR